MAIIDTLEYHHKVQYADSVRQLAGSPERSIFKELCSKESKQGESVMLDSYGAAEDAVITDLSVVKTRAKDGADTFDKFNLLQTPHMNIERARTIILPKVIDWGHTMNEYNRLTDVTDPQSQTLKKGMERIWLKEDALFIGAAFATAVSRYTAAGTVGSVAMPAGQIITLANQAAFVLSVISQIKQKFESKYYKGVIYCAIPTTVKKVMIDNSDNKLTNKDFVDSSTYLTNYVLPDIYGVRFIPTPLLDAAINNGTTSKVRFLAWAPDGMVWNQWSGLETALGVAATEKFAIKAYMKEVANAVRNDDNLVVQGEFTG